MKPIMLLYPISTHKEADGTLSGTLRTLTALKKDLRFLHDAFNDPLIICPPFELCLIFDDVQPDERARGVALCLKWLRAADEVWLFEKHLNEAYATSRIFDELQIAHDRRMVVKRIHIRTKRKQMFAQSAIKAELAKMYKVRAHLAKVKKANAKKTHEGSPGKP